MFTHILQFAFACILMIQCGCASPQSTQELFPKLPFPTDVQVFGQQGEGRIQVLVIKEVRSPGVYWIPADATLADALKAAGGVTDWNKWHRSRIMHSNGDVERLGIQPKERELRRLMKDKDIVWMSPEVY